MRSVIITFRIVSLLRSCGFAAQTVFIHPSGEAGLSGSSHCQDVNFTWQDAASEEKQDLYRPFPLLRHIRPALSHFFVLRYRWKTKPGEVFEILTHRSVLFITPRNFPLVTRRTSQLRQIIIRTAGSVALVGKATSRFFLY